MKEAMTEALQSIGTYLPNLLGALAILVVGWVIAFVVAAIVRALLRRTTLDNRVARTVFGREDAKGMPLEDVLARVVFYIIVVFVLVAFFEALRLTTITQPVNSLLNRVFSYLPQVFGAAILLVIAWVIATVLRRVMISVLQVAKLDERLGAEVGEKAKTAPLSKTLADVVYWLVFLLFLPGVLDALGLQGPLEPVKTLLNRISEFMPNLIGAGLIIVVGWFVARIIQRIVTNLLAAGGLDRMSERVGLAATLGEKKLSAVVGLVLYVLVLIPVLIAGLNALQLDAITNPASAMLGKIMDALPAVFGAILVVLISLVVARVVSGLVANLLSGIGFNKLPVALGLSKSPAEGAWAPAAIVGTIVLAAIMLFASVEAARLLKFVMLAELLAKFIVFAGHVLMGLIIFALGLFLANLVAQSIRSSGNAQAGLWATIARVAILLLAGAMALRQMEIANEIVNLAFSLLLGAVAVAAALAFGLGGRESAARMLDEWQSSSKSKKS